MTVTDHLDLDAPQATDDLNRHLRINAGPPGAGGAPIRYEVWWEQKPDVLHSNELTFHTGNPAEVGCTGITNEVLLAILIDRMRGFQTGVAKSLWNDYVLGLLELALKVLKARQRERAGRGVLGQVKP